VLSGKIANQSSEEHPVEGVNQHKNNVAKTIVILN